MHDFDDVADALSDDDELANGLLILLAVRHVEYFRESHGLLHVDGVVDDQQVEQCDKHPVDDELNFGHAVSVVHPVIDFVEFIHAEHVFDSDGNAVSDAVSVVDGECDGDADAFLFHFADCDVVDIDEHLVLCVEYVFVFVFAVGVADLVGRVFDHDIAVGYAVS